MSKARKIARCLIAFAFAFAFAVNSVFASYNDAAGYYSILGGGWNWSNTTSTFSSPYGATGTYQLSLARAISDIHLNTGRIMSDTAYLTTISSNISSIKSSLSDPAGVLYKLDTLNTRVLDIRTNSELGYRYFWNAFDSTSQPNSFASQLLNSVLDPTERAIRDASDDAANSVIDENNGYYGSGRAVDTVSNISSISSFADNLDFFKLDTDASDFVRIFTPVETSGSLFSFFTQSCFSDMNKTYIPLSATSSSVLTKSRFRDDRQSRLEEVNDLIYATMSPDDPRLLEVIDNVR